MEGRIRAPWNAVPLNFLRNAIDSQPGRVRVCVDNAGGPIAKWYMW
jgi:hypothetical protein